MNKKIMMAVGAVCILAVAAIGIYFYNSSQTKDNFIDFSKGQEKTCNITNTQQSILMAYTEEEKTYIAVTAPGDSEITATCELPFENNENIYMSQNQNGNLFIYNDAEEVFQFNGSHFTKIPSNLYSGNTNVNFTTEGKETILSLHAGSVNLDKTITFASGYNLKNVYVFADLKDIDTLNLYRLDDPGSELTNSFLTLRIKAEDTLYYVIYDVDTGSLLRVIANPFETADGAFYAAFEDDKYLLFAGTQTYDINANEMIEHDAANMDEAAVAVEYGPYSEDNPAEAVKIKASNGDIKTYVMQSSYALADAYIVMK